MSIRCNLRCATQCKSKRKSKFGGGRKVAPFYFAVRRAGAAGDAFLYIFIACLFMIPTGLLVWVIARFGDTAVIRSRIAKWVIQTMVEEAGAEIWLNPYVTEILRSNGAIEGVNEYRTSPVLDTLPAFTLGGGRCPKT